MGLYRYVNGNVFISFSPGVFMIGVALIILSALVLFIWVSVEVKRAKHKIWAIVIIALILFGYLSFSVSLKGKDIDYKSVGGVFEAGKVYFSWLGSALGNVKTITGGAVQMDWKGNSSSTK